MNLNHLAVFHAVAQERGFSKGANFLRISQPAVSKEIRELESRIGMTLIHRSHKVFRLTQAGELLASYARRIFALEEEAQNALQEMQGLKRGRLSVGASTTIGVYLLPPLLGIYRSLYPEIELNLEISNTMLIRQRLIDHVLQIGLVEGLVDNPDLEATEFMEDDMVVIAPPHHPLLERSLVTAEELCRQMLILREQGSGPRVLIERLLGYRGLSVKPIMSLGNTEAIKRAVASGIGLGIVSKLAIGIELAAGRLAVIPISDMTFRRPLHLIHTRHRHHEPTVLAFLKLIEEHLEQPTGP